MEVWRGAVVCCQEQCASDIRQQRINGVTPILDSCGYEDGPETTHPGLELRLVPLTQGRAPDVVIDENAREISTVAGIHESRRETGPNLMVMIETHHAIKCNG